MKYSISCFIPNHRVHKGHTMAHFLDAVIKPVKFFGVFFSQKKQTNRKKYSQKTRGAKDLSKD